MGRVEDHRCTIASGFLSGSKHAECSCGWTGGPVRSDHEALADHAAHVHVALGWATEDE